MTTPAARAIARYGTTTEPHESGWLLPDGTLIDFGRTKGKYIEHFEAAEHAGGEFQYGDDPIRARLNEGWVRVAPVHGGAISFEFARPLTYAQRTVVRDATLYSRDGSFDVWSEVGGTLHTFDADPPTPSNVARALRQADSVFGSERRRRIRRSRRP